MNRIVANHLEDMALFAPLVLVADLADISTPLTQLGAGLFVVGRAAFSVIYALGVPVLRSVAWGVGVAGLLLIATEIARTQY